MAIPQSTIEEIKYRSDLVSVISSYISLKQRGKNLIGLCPFHGEKTPSFTVYPENGSFYCFGCKVGGDVFTFTKMIENLDYIDAVRLLAERCGVVINETEKDDTLHNLRNTVYEINRETARFYYSNLFKPAGKWALEYYISRGLSPETIKSFGLGVALPEWDALAKHLRSKGFKFEDMVQADVVTKSNKGTYFDRFRDRTMFPVINIRGNVIAFSGRRRTEDKTVAKYVNTKDTVVYNKSQNLFAINFAKANCSEQIILVEGNFDAVALHQAGFKNVVAPLGTAFTIEQAQLLNRYTKEVIICFDSDEAGKIAVEKAFKTMANMGLSIKVLTLPEGKDPDEFLKKHQAFEFQKLIDNAVPETEYKLIKAADNIDPEAAIDSRIKYINTAVEILAGNTDPIAVEFYLTKLANEYNISKETLVAKVAQIRKNRVAAEKKRESKQMVDRTHLRKDVNPEKFGNERAAGCEEMILSILMNHPDSYKTLVNTLNAADFVTNFNARIYSAVCEVLDKEQVFSITALGDTFAPQEIGFISKLLNTGFKGDEPTMMLADCVKVLKEEKARLSKPVNNDDWATQMKRIAENKKGN